MFSTPEFWVCIAFFLFFLVFGKRLFSTLNKALDEHSQKVAQQLEEANRLHEEARSLLESYKEKHKSAFEQAEKIRVFGEKENEALKESSEQVYTRFVHQKEKALLERLEIEKEDVMAQLRQEAVEQALILVENALSKDTQERKRLTAASLQQVEGMFLGKHLSDKNKDLI